MQSDNVQRVHYDYWLLFSTIFLVAIGVVMVYSSSAVFAADRFGDTYYFLKKEIVFVLLGGIAAFVAAKIPYVMWRRFVYPFLLFSMALVCLAYIPGLRSIASGAGRWVQIGPLTFQPSELIKLTFIIFLAYSFEKKRDKMRRFGIGVLPHLLVGSVVMGMVLGQRDFGSTFVIGSVMMFMLFIAGVRKTYLFALLLTAMPLAYFAIASVAYRRARIMAFLDPWSDRYGSGFQIIQSLISFHQGGLWGRGLGEGQQKLFYLPEAHTDFIAAVLGEELGLSGMIVLVALFLSFTARGLRVSWRAPDLFGRYVAFGITTLIAWQAIANLGVVLGLLPTKGMVLPFVSYGGSSLLVTLFAVGILLNISSYRTPTGSVMRVAQPSAPSTDELGMTRNSQYEYVASGGESNPASTASVRGKVPPASAGGRGRRKPPEIDDAMLLGGTT